MHDLHFVNALGQWHCGVDGLRDRVSQGMVRPSCLRTPLGVLWDRKGAVASGSPAQWAENSRSVTRGRSLAAWESTSKRQGRDLTCPHCKSPTQCLALRVNTDRGKPRSNQAGLPAFVREMIERLDGALATAAAAEADARAVAEATREALEQQAADQDARVRVREEDAVRAKLEAEEALMRARQAESRATAERSSALKERETHERATREIALRLQRANAMVRAGKA